MGVVGERRLQELIDQVEFEVRNGTPRDIASRGLFEQCAEGLEKHEELSQMVSRLQEDLDEIETDQRKDLAKIEDLEAEQVRLEGLLEAEQGRAEQLGVYLKEARARIFLLEKFVRESYHRGGELLGEGAS